MMYNSNNLPALPMNKAQSIFSKLDFCDFSRIDEAKFFDDELIKFVNILANLESRVILLSLDMDYFRKTFDLFVHLISRAGYDIKLQWKLVNSDLWFFPIGCRSLIGKN